MPDDVRIRRIEPGDRLAVMELHRQHYWRSHCLLLNEAFYTWQFKSPPESLATGGDQSVVAVDDRGRLMSFVGVVVAPCSFHGRTLLGAHLITWLSDPATRGRGVGRQLMSFMTERFDFLFGRSATPASLSIYRRLGFRYFHGCSRWVAVLDPDATFGLAVDPSEEAVARLYARWVRGDAQARFSASRRMPVGAASAAKAMLRQCLTFDRSGAYFQWRYEQHPYLAYDFLWVGSSEAPRGVAVVRVEDVVGRPGRVLRVVEFLAAPAQAAQLGAAVLAFGREQGCAFADAFGMSERFVAGFVASGAFNTLEEPDLRLPHLFQPWSSEINPPSVVFFGKRAADGIGHVDDVSSIHISKGDGNMDWPSWNPACKGDFAPAVQGFAQQNAA